MTDGALQRISLNAVVEVNDDNTIDVIRRFVIRLELISERIAATAPYVDDEPPIWLAARIIPLLVVSQQIALLVAEWPEPRGWMMGRKSHTVGVHIKNDPTRNKHVPRAYVRCSICAGMRVHARMRRELPTRARARRRDCPAGANTISYISIRPRRDGDGAAEHDAHRYREVRVLHLVLPRCTYARTHTRTHTRVCTMRHREAVWHLNIRQTISRATERAPPEAPLCRRVNKVSLICGHSTLGRPLMCAFSRCMAPLGSAPPRASGSSERNKEYNIFSCLLEVFSVYMSGARAFDSAPEDFYLVVFFLFRYNLLWSHARATQCDDALCSFACVLRRRRRRRRHEDYPLSMYTYTRGIQLKIPYNQRTVGHVSERARARKDVRIKRFNDNDKTLGVLW